jgi:transcriptional regulator with XRE-family HTH domain
VSYQRDAISVDVGVRLKELQVYAWKNYASLATKSGRSTSALRMIERGKTSPSVSTLYKLNERALVSRAVS